MQEYISSTLLQSTRSIELNIKDSNTSDVYSVAITSDNKYIVSIIKDYVIRLWDINSGEQIRTFEDRPDRVFTVAITPDNKYIVSGNFDGTIKLLDIDSGKEIRTFDSFIISDYGIAAGVHFISITPDGKHMIFGSKNHSIIKLYNIENGKEIRTFKGHSSNITSIAISVNGKYMVSSSVGHDDTIRLWNINNGKEIRAFNFITSSVAITPDCKHIVSEGVNERKIWDISSGKEVKTFKAYHDDIDITPDGNYIISSNYSNNVIKLLDMNNGKVIKTFKGHSGGVPSVFITLDGRYIVSGSYDGTVKLWDIASASEIVEYVGLEKHEWISSTPLNYYNCSDKAGEYFNFQELIDGIQQIIPHNNPIYKKQKKERLVKLKLDSEEKNTEIKINILELTHQLLEITNKILSEAMPDTSWMKKLLDWGNKHIHKDYAIFPRTENEIIESKSISLRWNRLVNIPEELCSLKQLKILELNNNNLTGLPARIAMLENLEELNLNINNLIELPEEITHLKKLKVLNIKNNKYLELSNNQISWLNNLVTNGCTVKYDKYKFNLGE